MLVQIFKATMVAAVLVWARRRWKWLGACVAAILAAIYLHAEFLDYVDALPADSDQAVTADKYIPLSFVLKNTVILGSLLAYLLFEIWTWLRRKTNRRGPAESSSSRFKMRTWLRRKTNRRGPGPRRTAPSAGRIVPRADSAVVDERREMPPESSSSRTTVESASGGTSAPDTDNADDGFDFLRHGRKLENRAQKVIKRKP